MGWTNWMRRRRIFVHTFLNFTKISTFETVFSTDTLLFTPKVELLFSHALRKYENVVLEKYLSPSPELSKSAERSECSFSMRMKSNSAPKQILVTTSPELGKWESCPVTLKSFLDTLWWRWVNTSCYKMISMYVRGLISRFQWVSVSFQWGEALQRFCTRSRGVAKAVSVFAKVKKSTNTETAMLSIFDFLLVLSAGVPQPKPRRSQDSLGRASLKLVNLQRILNSSKLVILQRINVVKVFLQYFYNIYQL